MKSTTNWIHVNVKICIIAVTEFSASFRSSRWGNCLKTGSRISAERGIDLIAEGLLGYSILLLFFLLNPHVFTEQKYQSVEWSFALVKPWGYQMASFDVLLWSTSINFRHTACTLCEGPMACLDHWVSLWKMRNMLFWQIRWCLPSNLEWWNYHIYSRRSQRCLSIYDETQQEQTWSETKEIYTYKNKTLSLNCYKLWKQKNSIKGATKMHFQERAVKIQKGGRNLE